MIRSHSSATNAGDLLIEECELSTANCGIGQWHDFAVPPTLYAARPLIMRYLIQRLCGGGATNKIGRRRPEKVCMNRGTLPRYTFKKSRRMTSRNGEILPIICGKTQVSKHPIHPYSRHCVPCLGAMS